MSVTRHPWVHKARPVGVWPKLIWVEGHSRRQVMVWACLMLLLLGSAMGLVAVKDKHRRVFMERESLLQQQAYLQVRQNQLLLELGMLSSAERVQREAHDHLQLQAPRATQTVVLSANSNADSAG